MPEHLEIAFESFLRLGVTFALIYGLYHLVLFIASRLRGRFSRDGSREAWDSVEILYRIPFGVFGFLVLNYSAICIGSTIGSAGGGIHGMASPLIIFFYGMNSLAGLAGCAVIFGATVFGIYTDYPPTRTKLLGVSYTAAFFIGSASRW